MCPSPETRVAHAASQGSVHELPHFIHSFFFSNCVNLESLNGTYALPFSHTHAHSHTRWHRVALESQVSRDWSQDRGAVRQQCYKIFMHISYLYQIRYEIWAVLSWTPEHLLNDSCRMSASDVGIKLSLILVYTSRSLVFNKTCTCGHVQRLRGRTSTPVVKGYYAGLLLFFRSEASGHRAEPIHRPDEPVQVVQSKKKKNWFDAPRSIMSLLWSLNGRTQRSTV